MTNAQGAATPMDEPLLLVHAYLDSETRSRKFTSYR
jgi:hypothetical protein